MSVTTPFSGARPFAPLPAAPVLAFIFLASALAGCSSMSADDCKSADWHDRGMRQALAGKPRAQLEKDREACAKAGVALDPARYVDGYAAGARRFCTPDNGARWGRQGKPYRVENCPADLQPEFERRYKLGQAAFTADQAVQWLNSQQASKQAALDKAGDDATRDKLRRELRDIDRRLGDARDSLDLAERRLRGY